MGLNYFLVQLSVYNNCKINSNLTEANSISLHFNRKKNIFSKGDKFMRLLAQHKRGYIL
jgi:hypothetical protein